MINCISIFFSWYTFKLYILNAVKCELTLRVLVAYQMCTVGCYERVAVLVLFYTGDWGVCATVGYTVSSIGL
jgi:hypothetical protein